MNYNEIKQEQLKTKVPNAAELANTILKSIVNFSKPSELDSPLVMYHDLCVLLDQVDEIYHQAHIAALDYIRVKETKDFTAVSNNDWEDEKKKTPFQTIDGVEFQYVRVANFRNLATKDKLLNRLILDEREAKATLKQFSSKVIKRITALRTMPEFKKAKPHEVHEAIHIKYDDGR